MLFRQVNSENSDEIDRLGNMDNIEKIKQQKQIERKCSRRRIADLFPPINRFGTLLAEKVSFCTSYIKCLRKENYSWFRIKRDWKKASLAVETAFVLPLFFMGTVTMISFMDVYKLETEKLVSLCERTKEAGMYAYVLDASGTEEIILPDLYSYQPIGGWISLPKIWLYNLVKVHAWTGKEYTDGGGETEEAEEGMVYVTETGSVYHVDPDCTYLNLSVAQTSGDSIQWMTNDYGAHYHACKTCSRNQAPADVVYITGSGTSYHNQESCSGLKRTVTLVPETQVEGMHVCSRCG